MVTDHSSPIQAARYSKQWNAPLDWTAPNAALRYGLLPDFLTKQLWNYYLDIHGDLTFR